MLDPVLYVPRCLDNGASIPPLGAGLVLNPHLETLSEPIRHVWTSTVGSNAEQAPLENQCPIFAAVGGGVYKY
jgi:hypothetical protein